MSMPTPNPATMIGMFVRSAWNYWADIHPFTRSEMRHWRKRAATIADPELRRLALHAQREKWGDLEGAAAFAGFVPARHRRHTAVRALIAFQAAYDYVDTISEQPSHDRAVNGHQLHSALLVALQPGAPHGDYYLHHPRSEDGGLLREMVDATRHTLVGLPSHEVVAPFARRSAELIMGFQSVYHSATSAEELAPWGRLQTPAGADLHWWEACAASGSSLDALALIAAATEPGLTNGQAEALFRAYHPWINALHTLLDSLIDYPHDVAAGQYNLTEMYGSAIARAGGMRRLATYAMERVSELPDRTWHLLLLTAMASLYLSAPEAELPHARHATVHVLETLGAYAVPSMMVLRLRRAALKQALAEGRRPRG
jgi:tetraprenyl-beta-curcumene synthase